MSAPILACHGLGRTFQVSKGLFARKAPLKAVDGVTLAIARGETLAIVGESGCGKTTLAKMLLGLLPPSEGEITLDGALMSGIDRRQLARRIQPVFQDPYSSLNPRKTVLQIVGLPLVVHALGTPAERRRRVEAIMDLVGLPRRLLHSCPAQLSGGQRQRVAIARALVIRPDIFICDEPTSALDVSVQALILNLLLELRRELGLTFVFISHDLAVVEHMASRVAVMYLGRVVEEGAAADVFDDPRHPLYQGPARLRADAGAGPGAAGARPGRGVPQPAGAARRLRLPPALSRVYAGHL